MKKSNPHLSTIEMPFSIKYLTLRLTLETKFRCGVQVSICFCRFSLIGRADRAILGPRQRWSKGPMTTVPGTSPSREDVRYGEILRGGVGSQS
jgi:hypothetical protein